MQRNIDNLISANLDENKYQIIIGSKGILIRNGKGYIVDSEKFKQGVELTEQFIEAYFAGYSGIGYPSEVLHNMLKKAEYSDTIMQLILECMRATAPIDLTIIHSIYNCKPTDNNIEISEEEKEYLIRGYIINILRPFYEEMKTLSEKKDYSNESDGIYSIEARNIVKLVEKYKNAQQIANIEIIYNFRGISNSELSYKEKETIKKLAKYAYSYGIGKIQGDIIEEIIQFAKKQRAVAIETVNKLLEGSIYPNRDCGEQQK